MLKISVSKDQLDSHTEGFALSQYGWQVTMTPGDQVGIAVEAAGSAITWDFSVSVWQQGEVGPC